MSKWLGRLRLQPCPRAQALSARWTARAAAASAVLVLIVPVGLDVAAWAESARACRAVRAHVFRLKLAHGVVYAEQKGKHLFLQPTTPDWMVVNENGAILLSRCDGAPVEKVLGDAGESLGEQARALFTEALARGLLVDLSTSRLGKAPEVARPAQREDRQPLGMVHLKLTNQCNLHCSYCYAESGQGAAVLSWGELERIALEVATISPSVAYVLSGGEPLLHPSAIDFAEAMRAAGNSVHLLTNGTLINELNVRRIAAAANVVKISLDGSSERIHAATRGVGNFARATRAIDLLLACGANVMVAMTVTRANCRDIPAMVERYGERLALQPLFKAGRSSGSNDLTLSGLEYHRALQAVDGVAPMGGVDAKLKSLRGRGVRRCAMAEREISIAETGDVYPCQLLYDDRFLAGNVRKQSVGEIYADSQVFARMREVSVDTLAKCSSCAVRYLCGGACRARDRFEVGSEELVGEFCAYEREALLNGIFDSVAMRTV